MSSPTTLKQHVKAAVASVEQATGLAVAMHRHGRPFTHGASDLLATHHVTPFCMKIKKHQEPLCRICDMRDIYTILQEPQPPIVRTCHAGADEVIAPVHLNRTLVLVIFLGQFHLASRETAPVSPDFRLVEDVELRYLQAQAAMLAGFMTTVAQQIIPADRPGRIGRIEEFLDLQLQYDPSLSDLAHHLGLSVSRTSHLVRELTHHSFRELKEQRKLAMARDLLAHTDLRIADIGKRIGVQDPNYFSRYFTHKTAITPTDYRRQHTQAGI